MDHASDHSSAGAAGDHSAADQPVSERHQVEFLSWPSPIGFPDLVSVWMNTSLNQSGRAIPIVAMTMAFYCLVSLFVSLIMNAYNRRILLKER